MEYYVAISNNEIVLYMLTKKDVHYVLLGGKSKLQNNDPTFINML